MEGVFLFRSWFLNAPGQVLFARVNAEQCTEFQSSKKKRVKHLGKKHTHTKLAKSPDTVGVDDVEGR